MKVLILTVVGGLAATGAASGFLPARTWLVGESKAEDAPALVERSPLLVGAASSDATEATGVAVQVIGGDPAIPSVTVRFWFPSEPEPAAFPVVDAASITWDGTPVELRTAETGPSASAEIVLPAWEPGPHSLAISRFGQIPVFDDGVSSGAEQKWIDGAWQLDVQLTGDGAPDAARPLLVAPEAGDQLFEVVAAEAKGGRWVVTLRRDDQWQEPREWVSVPAFLELPGGDLLAPGDVSQDGPLTVLSFVVDEGLTGADLVVSAWVSTRDEEDQFVLNRAAGSTEWDAPGGVTVVEDSELFGLTFDPDGDRVFSAFGNPTLTDDLGNEYALDWRRVGFGKSDPSAPFKIVNGKSAARFTGPIDPAATELRLSGGPGGWLVRPASPRVGLQLD